MGKENLDCPIVNFSTQHLVLQSFSWDTYIQQLQIVSSAGSIQLPTCRLGFHVAGKLTANAIVVGADVVEAPASQLLSTMELTWRKTDHSQKQTPKDSLHTRKTCYILR